MLTRAELERQALVYLDHICEETGGVPTEDRMVGRAEAASALRIDEPEVVGHLGSKGFVSCDAGRVWLTPKGRAFLLSQDRCRNPKGIEGRPNYDDLDRAATRFMEFLYDRLDGVADQHRDAPSTPIASAAGIDHQDDQYFVVVELLSEQRGLIGVNGMSAAYLTHKGAEQVERWRAQRGS